MLSPVMLLPVHCFGSWASNVVRPDQEPGPGGPLTARGAGLQQGKATAPPAPSVRWWGMWPPSCL